MRFLGARDVARAERGVQVPARCVRAVDQPIGGDRGADHEELRSLEARRVVADRSGDQSRERRIGGAGRGKAVPRLRRQAAAIRRRPDQVVLPLRIYNCIRFDRDDDVLRSQAASRRAALGRIDGGCAPRGHVRREQRDRRDAHRHGDERERVARAHTVQQPSERARRERGGDDAHDETGAREPHSFAQHQCEARRQARRRAPSECRSPTCVARPRTTSRRRSRRRRAATAMPANSASSSIANRWRLADRSTIARIVAIRLTGARGSTCATTSRSAAPIDAGVDRRANDERERARSRSARSDDKASRPAMPVRLSVFTSRTTPTTVIQSLGHG